MEKRKPVVYVAGPYTKPDPIDNTRTALGVADALLPYGFIPLVPHLTAFWHLYSKKPYEKWMEIDQGYLAVCDALYRFPGESPGADREEEYAREHGIPVLDASWLSDFIEGWKS
jgi:hypothetical protein